MTASAFVYYWITFAVLVPVFSAVVFLLARRAGYFKDQDRLRYLALWAEVPEENQEKADATTRGRGDREKTGPDDPQITQKMQIRKVLTPGFKLNRF